MAKSVLITGASGFIGQRCTELLLAAGYDVYAGVRATSNTANLTGARIVILNMSDKEQLRRTMREHSRWDYVIHTAGLTKALHKQDFRITNTDNTVRLVECLMEEGYTPEKFIFISSLSAEQPNTEYGRSKLAAENYFATVKDELNYVILRPTGVYGPRERDYLSVFRSVKRGWDAQAGYSQQTLTFVYADDVVQAIRLAMEKDTPNGTIYNVSDGDNYSASDFSKLIANELSVSIRRICVPLWLLWCVCLIAEVIAKVIGKPCTLNTDKYRIMAKRSWQCNIDNTRMELGYAPQYPLADGVRATTKWYKENGWL